MLDVKNRPSQGPRWTLLSTSCKWPRMKLPVPHWTINSEGWNKHRDRQLLCVFLYACRRLARPSPKQGCCMDPNPISDIMKDLHKHLTFPSRTPHEAFSFNRHLRIKYNYITTKTPLSMSLYFHRESSWFKPHHWLKRNIYSGTAVRNTCLYL